MNLYIKTEGRQWKASAAEVLRLMGFADGRAPVVGAVPVTIQDIEVWVAPLDADRDRRSRRKEHRLMAKCPACGKVVSVGRLRQHSRVHAGEAR